jgi:hypothetical protein
MLALWTSVVHVTLAHTLHHVLREGVYIALAAQVGLVSGLLFDRFARPR